MRHVASVNILGNKIFFSWFIVVEAVLFPQWHILNGRYFNTLAQFYSQKRLFLSVVCAQHAFTLNVFNDRFWLRIDHSTTHAHTHMPTNSKIVLDSRPILFHRCSSTKVVSIAYTNNALCSALCKATLCSYSVFLSLSVSSSQAYSNNSPQNEIRKKTISCCAIMLCMRYLLLADCFTVVAICHINYILPRKHMNIQSIFSASFLLVIPYLGYNISIITVFESLDFVACSYFFSLLLLLLSQHHLNVTHSEAIYEFLMWTDLFTSTQTKYLTA